MVDRAAVLERLNRTHEETLPLPNLTQIQTDSYQWFLDHGMLELFEHFSPIEDYTGNLALEFLDYRLGDPKRTEEECREADVTYEAPIYAKVRLVDKETGEIKESEIYLGELPLMTDRGTFVINGAERVVISQLSRSPGVYFRDTIDNSGRVLYAAQIIPAEGAWVEIGQAVSGAIGVKIGQTRRFPVTTLIRAFDWFDEGEETEVPRTGTNQEILEYFGAHRRLEVRDLIKSFQNTEERGIPGAESEQVFYSLERVLGPQGEALLEPYAYITEKAARALRQLGRQQIRVLQVPFEIHVTLQEDDAGSNREGLLRVYTKIRPGDVATVESAESLLSSYFFDIKRYDLSRVGRYKVNRKLGESLEEKQRQLNRADLLNIVKYLLHLSTGEGELDDIDHLQNKRVRAVGELLQAQLRTGFFRMERVARERMNSLSPEDINPATAVSIKPLAAAINSFFGSGQLSQFMDQINPLAELAHERRLSALGPGGLSKQSAKLEVRDVHHSHYGRICPIETPEGPNVGLIGYLTLHARLNEYGFIETPYRKVVGGRVTPEIVYLSAEDEEQYHIASSSENTGPDGRFSGPTVLTRFRGEFPQVPPDEVDFCDVSPRQVFSVATAMIPFIENTEAVRALAGSNMQRQAVPLLCTEPPLISSGLEGAAARDSRAIREAEDNGIVLEADANHIKVQYDGLGERVYNLKKFQRTNMGTCANEHPRVMPGQRVAKGDTLIDGCASANGELALGKNLLVCFLPWEGYNFEDAILISERVVREDLLTSVHVERYECEARDTKLGPEEITRDIPNVGEDALRQLDEAGVVRVGAEVLAEDILVGKVAPKGRAELTAEEKLVVAIFGKKAEDMRDVSLRVPHGQKGIVIGSRIFSRFNYQCKQCEAKFGYGKALEHHECERCGGTLRSLPPDELKPGVNQMVRVFVAQRRKVTVGDKLTGRHGNKGVISRILPVEDMPYLADGTPVDVCLNPLSVPSRMNIGQIMETHLAWVAHYLNEQFESPVFMGFSAEEIRNGMRLVGEMMQLRALQEYALSHLSDVIGEWNPEESGAQTADELAEDLVRLIAERPGEELLAKAEWLGLDVDKLASQAPQEQARALVEEVRRDSLQKAQFDPEKGRATLYDGRSGDPFNQQVAVGFMYILKLHHLAEDKIHARCTGPYSLITQQPLGGKAQMGGQRFGEMEVWALEAYGAAYTLQEMLTIKSDDVQGRVQTYESIVKSENIQEPGIPESFKILVREMQSLALSVEVEGRDGSSLDLNSDTEGYR
ncbi:MAG: DNA-directed RNA polymerase subunit beta [candidate division WS1 bacterium]|nr:DNA-directed RNA polymerase subunit beta [candidate division WS1 bacterium]